VTHAADPARQALADALTEAADAVLDGEPLEAIYREVEASFAAFAPAPARPVGRHFAPADRAFIEDAPRSDEAEAAGCLCEAYDDGSFTVAIGCPVHWPEGTVP